MFDLELSYSVLLVICLIAACGFEFVNGFHDTANAVATVIYTNSLKPWVAVVWSGLMNSVGVFAGGIAVAMGIVNLLPVETLIDQNVAHSLSMVGALLISAIFWNLLTWYFGIPCSSSHTLIGSILGVGIAYSLLPESTGVAVDWSQAGKIGMSLLVSPAFGFTLTIILMYLIRTFTKGRKNGDELFEEPKKNTPPPPWIRGILLLTCTSVSFFHGQNDGQKGVGLVMLVLIGIVPGFFALKIDLLRFYFGYPPSRALRGKEGCAPYEPASQRYSFKGRNAIECRRDIRSQGKPQDFKEGNRLCAVRSDPDDFAVSWIRNDGRMETNCEDNR
jgi:PiT family inorganic phosphate transporter